SFATRMNTLRLLIRYGQRESQYFRARLPVRLKLIGEVGACFEAAVSLGQRLPQDSRYRDLVAAELRDIHEQLKEEFEELTTQDKTARTNPDLEAAIDRCNRRLADLRDQRATKIISHPGSDGLLRPLHGATGYRRASSGDSRMSLRNPHAGGAHAANHGQARALQTRPLLGSQWYQGRPYRDSRVAVRELDQSARRCGAPLCRLAVHLVVPRVSRERRRPAGVYLRDSRRLVRSPVFPAVAFSHALPGRLLRDEYLPVRRTFPPRLHDRHPGRDFALHASRHVVLRWNHLDEPANARRFSGHRG